MRRAPKRVLAIVLFPVAIALWLTRRRRARLRWGGPPPGRRGPDAGVREPRTPAPIAGAGAGALPEPDE